MALIKKDGKNTIAELTTKDPIDLDKSDFFSLFAHAANAQKASLIQDLMGLISKGDASAVRLLEKALSLAAPDEKNRPIPILMGATQKQNAIQSDNSAQ